MWCVADRARVPRERESKESSGALATLESGSDRRSCRRQGRKDEEKGKDEEQHDKPTRRLARSLSLSLSLVRMFLDRLGQSHHLKTPPGLVLALVRGDDDDSDSFVRYSGCKPRCPGHHHHHHYVIDVQTRGVVKAGSLPLRRHEGCTSLPSTRFLC